MGVSGVYFTTLEACARPVKVIDVARREGLFTAPRPHVNKAPAGFIGLTVTFAIVALQPNFPYSDNALNP